MSAKFSPSLMCMDLTQFKEQITAMNKKADFYHVDIRFTRLVAKKRYCPDYFLLYELGIYCMDSRRETFFLVETLATTHRY
ncbi:hypothetical protein SM68_01705 [Klebsiella pneumoniae]|nr:hypothetical protein SM68_01705 [Klebsiella pneumoniae]